jgi:Glyoxalase-like domain
MAAIDHLMWAVPDLAAGVDRLESLTGVRAAPGGAHPGMGTANALLGLGPGVYLEVIGPDPALDEPTGFGAILATLEGPELRSWAIRTDDIGRACAALTARGWPTEPRAMTRTTPAGTTLAWHVAMVPGRPFGDRWPFLIDWGASPHPSESAPPGGTLDALTIVDPEAAELTRLLRAVSCDDVDVNAGDAALTARLRTGAGPVDL